MCELSVYVVSGAKRDKVMESVIRLTSRDGKVQIEGILGDSMEIPGRIKDVDIIAQEAIIVA